MLKRLYLISVILLTACHHDDKADSPAATATCNNTVADVEKIQIFPASHPLNTDISAADLDPKSDAIITFLSSGNPGIKADFGSGLFEGEPIGIPFVVVCKDQSPVNIVFRGDDYDDNYGRESDPGPYPIPLTTPIEGNGNDDSDSHVIAVDVDNKKLYELYNADVSGNSWAASSGAVFDLSTVTYRKEGWTSADAAGLPIFPALVRYEEVASGTIDHAIRFTLPKSKIMAGYTLPARHLVNGGDTNAGTPVPMGIRLRLKASFDISKYSATNKVILTAMKKYGIILADVGSAFYVTGAPDDRWNNDDLQKLGGVKSTDFEVVKIGTIGTED
jgi:hypothetical protein